MNPDWAELLEIRRGPQPVLGSWDAEAANRGEPAYLVGTFPDGVVPELTHKGLPAVPPPSNQRLFAGVWDFYDTWRGEGNIGPLYVIDECHVSFPREQLRKGKMTPDEVIQWFKISRHFGADVLLMTQRMRALEEDVAGLAEMHIRVRKVAFLGRPNEYVRKVFAGLRGGEVSSDIRPYKPEFFGFYKSHTQGAAVIEAAAQDVAPSTVKWRRASRIMFALSGVGFIWLGWQIFGPAPEPKKASATAGKAHGYAGWQAGGSNCLCVPCSPPAGRRGHCCSSWSSDSRRLGSCCLVACCRGRPCRPS